MPRLIFFVFFIFQFGGCLSVAASNDIDGGPVECVNPFIGTANSIRPSMWESNGGTYPGAALPFGMVQATPEGYRYADDKIKWFSFINHTSGYPNGSSGDVYIMPLVGEIDEAHNGFESTFSHNNEAAQPGYYSVFLDDPHIKAELTVAPHAGFCRFHFQQSKDAKIAFGDFSEIKRVGEYEIHGRRGEWFFYAELDRAIENSTSLNDVFVAELAETQNNPVLLKIGFSKTSAANARSNLIGEIPDWNFDLVRRQAYDAWNDLLSRIKIFGATAEQRSIFYTALYHSFLDPHLESDVDQPRRYSQLSPWDTFRSKHPLITLLAPGEQLNMIRSVLDRYEKSGRLPAGPMTGNHNIPVIVDSYAKGISDFDVELAYEAMDKALSDPPYVRPDIEKYLRYGYVPAEQSYSATKTLEYAYNDWAMAEFARLLGREEDSERYAERALSYQQIFNPATKFMQAKTRSGDWVDEGFREGDKWTYSWFAPHDVQGLINLMGGELFFTQKLNHCFEQDYYVHDNEPPLHYAYLFNYAGKPGLTQKWVQEICRLNYTTDPGGLPGNDDLGALSAWYVLSAMGFYPVCPGRPIYDLGVPLFEEMAVRLENGNTLTIIKTGTPEEKFVSAVKLNGKIVDRLWLAHEELLDGGTLEFVMCAEPPNQELDKRRIAPSMTIGEPEFEIVDFSLDKSKSSANEKFNAITTIKNSGEAAGTFDFIVQVDGRDFRTESVIVEPGAKEFVHTEVQLYETGEHTIRASDRYKQSVFVKAVKPTFRLDRFSLPSPPLVQKGDPAHFTATVQNIGSFDGEFKAGLLINGEQVDSKLIHLGPGERQTILFEKAFDSTGLYKVAINDLEPQKIRVYKIGQKPETIYLASHLKPVLLLTFDDGPAKELVDLSAKTTAIVQNDVRWSESLYGSAIQTNALEEEYIEIQNSLALQKVGASKTLSMMAWIYPMEEQNFADFFTQGDWNVLQARASNTALNFYSGGWQRGEAYGTVPDGWNRNWHHVAGVTDGGTQKLYIDGELIAEKEIEIVDEKGAPQPIGDIGVPWNIGRNAQNPERFFKGLIDDVRIYLQPASQEEIRKIMLNDFAK